MRLDIVKRPKNYRNLLIIKRFKSSQNNGE